MAQINCSQCPKQDCPSRLEGALCGENKELAHLIKIFDSRDAVLVSRRLLPILSTEQERYHKAVENERIGEEYEEVIIDNKGNEHVVTKTREPNGDITQMAKGIITEGVKIYQMVNPPKVVPMFQQNNQYNIGAGIANEIGALSEEGQEKAIKFINEKLNAA